MFEREAKREKILESRMKEIRLKEKQLQQDHGDGDNNADGDEIRGTYLFHNKLYIFID